jgi:hypothetical protein
MATGDKFWAVYPSGVYKGTEMSSEQFDASPADPRRGKVVPLDRVFYSEEEARQEWERLYGGEASKDDA